MKSFSSSIDVLILFLVLCRPPTNFDSCIMEQCNEMVNTSLDTSFNITNQSSQSSRLSTGGANANVSLLKRRLFEDEEDEDVNLLPEDDDPSVNTVTSTQRAKSPPRCDSETEVRFLRTNIS